MKKILVLLLAALIVAELSAQGNSGGKGKSKDNSSSKNKDNAPDKDKNDTHDRIIWDGIGDNSCMKPSKNQPAKVRSSFARDYPNAINVRWTKCRGDWTASFNGVLFRSTAVYHANGDRRDTRTVINRDNVPRKILDIILGRPTGTPILNEVIKIEVPQVVKDIFRIKSIIDGTARFEYFNGDGIAVQYSY